MVLMRVKFIFAWRILSKKISFQGLVLKPGQFPQENDTMKKNLLKEPSILETGFKIINFPGYLSLLELSKQKNWVELDRTFAGLIKKGSFFNSLFQKFVNFNQIEYIINHRVAENDEDGIWHDDGSRLMAFSISLNLDPKSIFGGELLLRSKENAGTVTKLGPLPFGTIALFLTGEFGFDHKVCKVLKGERTTIAGWLS
jgi:hypothetical protein